MALDDIWVRNSVVVEVPTEEGFVIIMYFIIALAILILIHSYIINRKAKRKRKVTLLSDIVAICTLGQALSYLGCANGCSPRATAYALDLFGNALCGGGMQFCDNYIVFERFCYVYNSFGKDYGRTVSNLHRYLVAIYICLALYMPFFPFYTIMPWFVDCNSEEVTNWIIFLQANILSYTYIFYNCFYTGLMLIMIIQFQLDQQHEAANRSLRVLSIKAIIHNFLSSAAIVTYGYYLIYGLLLYSLILMIAIHFLFNWKIERYLKNINTSQSNKITPFFGLQMKSNPIKQIDVSPPVVEQQRVDQFGKV